jgi:hypothetical protein
MAMTVLVVFPVPRYVDAAMILLPALPWIAISSLRFERARLRLLNHLFAQSLFSRWV